MNKQILTAEGNTITTNDEGVLIELADGTELSILPHSVYGMAEYLKPARVIISNPMTQSEYRDLSGGTHKAECGMCSGEAFRDIAQVVRCVACRVTVETCTCTLISS